MHRMQTTLFLMGEEPNLSRERLWCSRLSAVRKIFILLLIETTTLSYSVANNVSASGSVQLFLYSFNLISQRIVFFL